MTSRLLAIAVLALLGWLTLLGTASAAVSCRHESDTDLDFGRPGTPIGPVETTSQVVVSCAGNNADAGKSALVCVGVNPGGTAPRQMWRNGTNVLSYQIYRNPGHTEVLNLQTNAFDTLTVGPGGSRVYKTFTFYGQLASPPASPIAGTYKETVTGVMGWSTAANVDCDSVPASQNFTFRSMATLIGSCSINANDLNFGTYPNLFSPVTGAASLVVTCTNGTLYRVSLNGGSSGSISNRRMRLSGVGPQTIAYNLYSDSARTQLWGDEVSGGSVVQGTGSGAGSGTPQTIQIYGLVPADVAAVSGNYSDVVTATVEY